MLCCASAGDDLKEVSQAALVDHLCLQRQLGASAAEAAAVEEARVTEAAAGGRAACTAGLLPPPALSSGTVLVQQWVTQLCFCPLPEGVRLSTRRFQVQETRWLLQLPLAITCPTTASR